MKLPGGDQAIIDPRKIIDYCLNPDHEEGQHKARLFASILGLTINHADQLLGALRTAAATEEAAVGRQDNYGQRYLVDFEFRSQAAMATIRSAWIIGPNETAPRLVTCYIL